MILIDVFFIFFDKQLLMYFYLYENTIHFIF